MKYIYNFDNGIKVYEDQLLDIQKARYEKHNLHEPEEEKIFLNLLNKIPEDGVFVNIGAAIGYYPLLAKMEKPRLKIFAFEPLNKHRKYFYQNIKLNGFKKNDFTIKRYGVSINDGKSCFKVHDYGSSIITGAKIKDSLFEKLKRIFDNTCINTIALQTLLRIVGGRIHLLQMDIQGHEKEVLQASVDILTMKKVGKIIIGTHGEKIHQECLNVLFKCNYKITYDNNNTELQPDGILVGEKDI